MNRLGIILHPGDKAYLNWAEISGCVGRNPTNVVRWINRVAGSPELAHLEVQLRSPLHLS